MLQVSNRFRSFWTYSEDCGYELPVRRAWGLLTAFERAYWEKKSSCSVCALSAPGRLVNHQIDRNNYPIALDKVSRVRISDEHP